MKLRFSTSVSLLRTAAAGSLAICLAGVSSSSLLAAEPVKLRPAKPDATPVHVTAQLEVGGHLKVANDSKSEQKPETLPMSVVGQFAYDEQRVDDGADADRRMSVRLYDQTPAVIKVGAQVTKPQLREDRKLIAAVATKTGAYLCAPAGPLSREELELIDLPANSLLLDELLPEGEVEAGRRWKPTDDTLAQLLNLDAVGHTEVECVLVAANDGVGEVTIEGTLGGAVDGVATEIELKGKLLVDLARTAPKSLLLAIKEQRGISHVSPGLDVVAKIKLTLTPAQESKLITSDVLKDAKLPQTDEAPALEYVSESKGYRFLYDRRWHITREEPDLLIMRLIERGDLLAQVNVMPSTKALEPLELQEYQDSVETILGKMFGKFERASQRGTESGLRVLQTYVLGAAQELPIEWRYYLVSDKQGHGLSVVFTLEAPLADQFSDQDKPLVDSVEFMEPKLANSAAAKSTSAPAAK
jgi:hypothetical protein